jgi:hypothetical protein
MSQYEMVVFIVAIAVGAGVVTTWMKTRAQARPGPEADAEMAELRGEVSRLKERVRVLETIVTDKDRALSEEIRRLG